MSITNEDADIKISDNKKTIKKKPIIKASKDDDKYKVLLKLINKILLKMGKEEIDDLTKFAEIDRDYLVKDEFKDFLTEMEEELFYEFDKVKCGYYRKTDGQLVNCIRGMSKQIGYSLIPKNKDITEIINGYNYRRTHVLYCIK